MLIYLLDDHAGARATIADMLATDDHRVYPYRDPMSLLAQVTQQRPDVVVTDYDLNDKVNGLDVTFAIRRRWPSVRIVLMSGTPHIKEEIRLMDAHDTYRPDAVLEKPVRLSDLLEAVQRPETTGANAST